MKHDFCRRNRQITLEGTEHLGTLSMTVYLNPLGEGRPIVIDKPILFVGRHPECDIILLNSRKVSRKHCCIAVVNNECLVRDLGSTNGISVNGQRVRKEAPVSIGDTVTFGDVEYRLLNGEVPAGAKIASQRDNLPDDLPVVPAVQSQTPPQVQGVDVTELSQEYPVVIKEDAADRQDFEEEEPPLKFASPGSPAAHEIPRPYNFDDESGPDVRIIDESKSFFEDEEDLD